MKFKNKIYFCNNFVMKIAIFSLREVNKNGKGQNI